MGSGRSRIGEFVRLEAGFETQHQVRNVWEECGSGSFASLGGLGGEELRNTPAAHPMSMSSSQVLLCRGVATLYSVPTIRDVDILNGGLPGRGNPGAGRVSKLLYKNWNIRTEPL